MNLIHHPAVAAMPDHNCDQLSALRFITCGSVDDGKSTLIGRLLLDSKSVLQDQLINVSQSGKPDLAQFTDGLSAEREQGITIDVAYRYFNTARRKFIIGDAPGHEQYTRNMVTAASNADAAVVLVDATKLQWQDAQLQLLAQTRRHSLLCQLLRVPGIVFAVNKLDALQDAARPETQAQAGLAFQHIRAALEQFARQAGIEIAAIVPMSALKGHNVVDAVPGWCGYHGPSLLDILQLLPTSMAETGLPLAMPVQWVEKFSHHASSHQGRRVFWGRIATGSAEIGQQVKIFPSGQSAVIAQVLNNVRAPTAVLAGQSAGIVLDREVDVSRGDWLLAPAIASTAAADDDFALPAADACFQPRNTLLATVAWMDDEPLVLGRVYWALHGHRWIKARVKRVLHRLDINTLAQEAADNLPANSIGHIELLLQEPVVALPFAQSRAMGSLVLVDAASHRTAAAVLVND